MRDAPSTSNVIACLPPLPWPARERIDECQNCADKAAALYASQARDDTLFNFATRIKARALAIRKSRFWFTVTSQQKANNRKEWT